MQTQILKTKEERKDFLENDFLDRLIRIEQRVSAKFGQLIKYTDTYCYKNLTSENRKRYEKYLKTKKKKKFAFAVSFLLPLFGVLFLSNGITGNVVKEGVGDSGFQTFYLVLFAFLAVLIIGTGLFFLIKFHRKKKFDPLFKPIERIAVKEKDL
jgi:ABC-type dipeptide/oligopeptide/nickel transport system permease component